MLISQSTSVNGLPGCPHSGFPIVICQTGSYRLSGNLLLSNAAVDAISVQVPNVSIDLNGFAITGPVSCGVDVPLGCTPANASGAGINALGSVSVFNGTVTGMGNGIIITGGSRVEHVQVYSNSSFGIKAGARNVIVNNIVYNNGNEGIFARDGATITGNMVYANGVIGIDVSGGTGSGATIAGNTVFANGGTGIEAISATMSGNTITNNTLFGIAVQCPSAVIGNTVSGSATNIVTFGPGCVVVSNAAP